MIKYLGIILGTALDLISNLHGPVRILAKYRLNKVHKGKPSGMTTPTIDMDSATNSNMRSRKFFETLNEAMLRLSTHEVVTVIVLTLGSNSLTA
jgi:hypothetical protein